MPLTTQGSGSTRQAGSGGSMSRDEWRVPLPPHLHGKAPRKHWNANALAFLGDSVWEVRWPSWCVWCVNCLTRCRVQGLCLFGSVLTSAPSPLPALQLYARRRFFYPPSRKESYFGQVVHHVRAETQVGCGVAWGGACC
jgi:hypothetical protein